MSHFARTRNPWNPATNLLYTEAEDLDIKTYKSINGDEGGTWSPSSAIIIGGSGMTINPLVAATMAGVAKLNYTSRSITRTVPWECPDFAGADWAFLGDNNYYWNNLTVGGVIAFGLDLPDSQSLTAVTITIDPPAHGGWPPANAPTLKIYRKTSGLTGTLLATGTDSLAVQATYEAEHTLAATLAHTIDRASYVYWCVFTAESGANSAVGTRLLKLSYTAAITSQTEY